MRIGELARRTQTSPRLLRYYEEQRLIAPGRSGNGYRDYDDRLVERVRQIRGLLDAGLPTRIIGQILPCLTTPGVLVCPEDASPEVLDALENEMVRMTARIEFLSRNRDAIAGYLDGVRLRRPRPSAKPAPAS
jgi:DNA-binding transcriptional MerR regulator